MRRFLERPYSALALAAAAAVLSVSLSLGWAKANEIAKQRVKVLIGKLQQRLDVPVEIGKWRIGFAAAHFEDVVIGHEANAVISRVTAGVNFNPFAGDVGELTDLTIHNIRIKSPRRSLAPHETAMAAGPREDAADRLERLFRALPVRTKLEIESGGLTLIDADGRPSLVIKGLRLVVEKPRRKVLVKARSITGRDGLTEQGLAAFLRLQRGAGYLFGAKSVSEDDTKLWEVRGEIARDFSSASVEYEAARIPSLARAFLGEQLPSGLEAGFKGRAKIERPLPGRYDFRGRMRAHGLEIQSPVVSKSKVGPTALTFATTGFYDEAARRLVLSTGLLSLPVPRSREQVRVHVQGALTLPDPDGDPAAYLVEGQVRLPATSCQSLIDAAPKGLVPILKKFELRGLAEAQVAFAFDGRSPADFTYKLRRARFDCKVTRAPLAFSKSHLSGPFTVQREVGKDGRPLEIAVSPMSPSFTPLDSIAKAMPAALVTSEDAGFWKHRGIDGPAIEQALRRNLAEGRISVGGSTITMQTVKNLFLTQDRTISRKLQELFLAWHLESILDKERILEIYMNVVEFGPGIYGITAAAEHYFGKHPFDLDAKEAAYLASLLPAPKVRFRHFCNGVLGREFKDMVDSLLRRMASFGRLDGARLGQAMASPLVFNEDARLSWDACRDVRAEIDPKADAT